MTHRTLWLALAASMLTACISTDPSTRSELYQAATRGDADAQVRLGIEYASGIRDEEAKDNSQAVYWYQQAAKQGNAAAQLYLGEMYYEGRGVQQDDSQAAYWVQQAAKKEGFFNAQLTLGSMYLDGRGVPRDDCRALHLYQQAAEPGLPKAQFNVGKMYEEGRCVPQDDHQAVHWYQQAAPQGNTNAQYRLGLMYYEGRGVQQDDNQAYFWFLLAASYGYPHSAECRDLIAKKLIPAALEENEKIAKRHFEEVPFASLMAVSSCLHPRCFDSLEYVSDLNSSRFKTILEAIRDEVSLPQTPPGCLH